MTQIAVLPAVVSNGICCNVQQGLVGRAFHGVVKFGNVNLSVFVFAGPEFEGGIKKVDQESRYLRTLRVNIFNAPRRCPLPPHPGRG